MPFDKDEKAIDIATTYSQILITLASGTIVVVLAVNRISSSLPRNSLTLLALSLVAFAISILSGLLELGGIIGVLQYGRSDGNRKPLTPYDSYVKWTALIQLLSYFVGVGLVAMAVVYSWFWS